MQGSLSKSAFIRGLPGHLRPKEVAALAKERGIVISEGYVRQVRIAAKDRAMRATPKSISLDPSVAEGPFAAMLRSLPAEIAYPEAAAKAKRAGVILSPGYFYALCGQRSARAVNSKPSRELSLAFEGLRLPSDDGCTEGP